jgi:hypothetical protein
MQLTDNYTPIPVAFSPEDGDWIVNDDDYTFFRCDCHDLLWHHREMVSFDLADGFPAFFRCDLPIETAV